MKSLIKDRDTRWVPLAVDQRDTFRSLALDRDDAADFAVRRLVSRGVGLSDPDIIEHAMYLAAGAQP